jgi:hypothetical protein
MTVMQWSSRSALSWRYLVGMRMCVDRPYELEVELAHELEIAVHFFHHRCFAAAAAGKDIGVDI